MVRQSAERGFPHEELPNPLASPQASGVVYLRRAVLVTFSSVPEYERSRFGADNAIVLPNNAIVLADNAIV
ncbi:MAG: hypothetical protein V7L20_04895 [Nostoc sp.]|uniref:hypothetical protein n=1 Tax=Nostoc sp. TaxID=1180 RepID=UPI002FF8FA87